jgi:hypothetical protein
MVNQDTQALQIYIVLPNSVAERKETARGFHHEANGDFKIVRAASCYGYACNRKGPQHFGGIIIHGLALSTGKILEENLV